MPVDIACRVRGEKDHRAAYLFRLRPAARRCAPLDPSGEFLVGQKRLIEFGGEKAGSDGIDRDAVTPDLGGHGARQPMKPRLRRYIAVNRRTSEDPGDRAGIDDTA